MSDLGGVSQCFGSWSPRVALTWHGASGLCLGEGSQPSWHRAPALLLFCPHPPLAWRWARVPRKVPWPHHCHRLPAQGVPSGSRGVQQGAATGGLGSASPSFPLQAMDPSSSPSVPLMIGCAVSCMALLTLLVIYAAFWR